MDQGQQSIWDPRTLSAVGGVVVGVLGLAVALLRERWSSHESRLDALGKVLRPLLQATQDLASATTCRRRCDQLQQSFPPPPSSRIVGVDGEATFPTRTSEVQQRIDDFFHDYNALMESSQRHFREAEVEWATRHFRFPNSIAREVQVLRDIVSEMGRVLNDGLLDKTDLQLALFRDRYKIVTSTAKGWRLADPFEWVKQRTRGRSVKEQHVPSGFELTQSEMEGVIELLNKRVLDQANNSFAVHPPQKLLANSDLLTSDSLVEELKDSIFSVAFQDGTARMLSLAELVAFVFNLIMLTKQSGELNKMLKAAPPDGPRKYQVTFRFAMHEIMTPEVVRMLFSKVAFSNVPSDA